MAKRVRMTRSSVEYDGRRPATLSVHVGILVAIQALLLVVLVAFAAINDFRRARTQAGSESARSAGLAAGLVGSSVADVVATLGRLAELPGYDVVFSQPESCTATAIPAGVFTRTDLHIVRADGTIACSSLRGSGGIEGEGYGAARWLSGLASKDQAVLDGPFVDPISGKQVLVVAVPLVAPDGALVEVLHVDALGPGLAERLSTANLRPEFLVLSGDRSTVVSRSTDPDASGVRLARSELARPIEPGSQVADLSGTQRIWAAQQIPDLAWHVYSGISVLDALQGARNSLRDRAVFAVASVLVVLGAGWGLQRRIARPVAALSRVAERATAGDMRGRVGEAGPREIAVLARQVNRMLQARAEAENALQSALNREQEAGQELRKFDRLKTTFLVAISHELRTPLTAVLGFSETLERFGERFTKEQIHDLAQRMSGQARRLERHVIDMLDLDRLSRGTLEPKRMPTDLTALTRQMLKTFDLDGRDVRLRGGRFKSDVDPALVERIMDILLANARRHTPPATPVEVRVAKRPDGTLLSVEDAGPGVPDELKTAIFEPFRHGAEDPGAQPGTGVGLALVAQFARVHGGRAWVEDRESGGAAFRVLLPDSA